MAMDPVTGLLEVGGKIIDKLFPDKTEASKQKIELIRLAQDGELKELVTRFQAIVAEAQSSDKWTSRARPSFLYVMYSLLLSAIPMGFLHAYNAALAAAAIEGMRTFWAAIPGELYALFGAGYMGYVFVRSKDKERAAKLMGETSGTLLSGLR